jgi:hypothetical protein
MATRAKIRYYNVVTIAAAGEGGKMPGLPKLKVNKNAWEDKVEIVDFEQAKTFPFDQEIVISVEGEQICSYDHLVQFAASEGQKNKEYLEVMILPMILGG